MEVRLKGGKGTCTLKLNVGTILPVRLQLAFPQIILILHNAQHSLCQLKQYLGALLLSWLQTAGGGR